MKSEFIIALTQLAAERNLSKEIVISAIEAALVSAYRRDSIINDQNISVKLDPGSGDVSVYVVKTVVEEVEQPQHEIALAEARLTNPKVDIGDVIPTRQLEHDAGRIQAQTAKQVVVQRLREAERELVFEEYADKEGEVYTVTVQRLEPKQLVVELGRAEAILPASEQAPYERYRVGQKVKVLLQSVKRSNKGPELIVSRADTLLLRRLFEMEVPEIYSGAVEIKIIAREAGFRSKVAVWARQDGVDAVGSCVGLRGIRIQNIVNELHGEKIDVVQWSKDPATLISNALSPSLVMRVEMVPETQTAVAVVPERQLSLAIGKEGQNARLAARLTGWNVDIKSNVEADSIPVKESSSPKSTSKKAPAVVEEQVVAEAVNDTVDKTDDLVPVVEVLQDDDEGQIVGETAKKPILEKDTAEITERIEQDIEDSSTTESTGELTEKSTVKPVEKSTEKLAKSVSPTEDGLASLRDLPGEFWSIKQGSEGDSGVIRFAEDIEEIRNRAPGRQRRGGRTTGASRGGNSVRRRTKSTKKR